METVMARQPYNGRGGSRSELKVDSTAARAYVFFAKHVLTVERTRLMRSRIFSTCIILMAACIPVTVMAGGAGSVFGGLSTAQPYGQGIGTIGISGGIADANSFGGWFGYGMSKYVDGRIKLAFWDAGPSTQLALGGDFKWQFWSVAEGSRYPMDMALGGFLEYLDGDGGSVTEIGSHLVASYPFRLSNGSTLSPYGRLNVRIEHVSVVDKSDIRFGLNAGAAWEASRNLKFFGEFQIDGNDGVFLGVEFGVM